VIAPAHRDEDSAVSALAYYLEHVFVIQRTSNGYTARTPLVTARTPASDWHS
jgi:hypothetical protein